MLMFRQFIKHEQLRSGQSSDWIPAINTYRRSQKPLLEEVTTLAKEAHIIALSDNEGKAVAAHDQSVPMASPFPVCWIELIENDERMLPLFLMSDEHLNELERQHKTEHIDADPREAGNKRWASGLIGALIHEIEPNLYDIYAMEIFGTYWDDATDGVAPVPDGGVLDNTTSAAVIKARSYGIARYSKMTPEAIAQEKAPVAMQILNRWLQMVNEGVLAVENTEECILIPRADRPHKRTPHIIRRIVRILPKAKYRKEVAPITPKGVIDWSHRWEVRGHWRRVKGLGKDRSGEYVVHGHTWVKNFVKGPKDKELVVKTRVLLA